METDWRPLILSPSLGRWFRVELNHAWFARGGADLLSWCLWEAWRKAQQR